ncbi:MAG: DegT/DnrJ/EryC1/StrS family aminotransferase [Actinomycetota bacterium]
MIPIARPVIGSAEEEAVLRVLRSGRLVQGPEVAAFEDAFAAMCGVPHAVACSNGTAALLLALLAHGIGPGDEVIVPSFTFAATAEAVLACGARPVFCDVREDDFCIDVADAETRIGRATRAIMPVHLYGQVADMDAVAALAEAHDLIVIEDACQAHGARYRGRAAGSFATAAFSLYATKNMMSGEGGVVTTSDDETADRLRLLRNIGMKERYVHVSFGLNLRLTEMQAAMASVQLARLAAANEERRANAAFYDAELAGLTGVVLPRVLKDRVHVWHQYTLRVPALRDEVLERLRAAGIGGEVYYPTPSHKQAAFAALVSLPVSEQLAQEVLSIPVFSGLTHEERSMVAKGLAEAMIGAR